MFLVQRRPLAAWIDAKIPSESGLMGTVYNNAYFTIAATSSTDGDGGCFIRRPLEGLVEVEVPFRYVEPISRFPNSTAI